MSYAPVIILDIFDAATAAEWTESGGLIEWAGGGLMDWSDETAGFIKAATKTFYTEAGTEYPGNILEFPTLQKDLADVRYGVREEKNITLKLSQRKGNYDSWSTILSTTELRNLWATIRVYDPTDGTAFLYRGKIQWHDLTPENFLIELAFGDDAILDTVWPRDTVTTDLFDDTALDVGKPVNICFGHCLKVPCYNIKTDFVNDYYDYVIGYGPIEGLMSGDSYGVWRDDIKASSSDYELLNNTTYPGYAVLRFTKAQLKTAGSNTMCKIFADINGLTLGGASAQRNFATIQKHIIENTAWGLSEEADVTSFSNAATTLTTDTFLCDIAITEQKLLRDHLPNFTLEGRTRLDRAIDGEWEITVAGTSAAITQKFGDNDGVFNNARIISKTPTHVKDAIKTIKVRYGYNERGDGGYYELSDSVNTFGIEKIVELLSVNEHVTAKAVLSYLVNIATYGDEFMTIETNIRGRSVDIGDVITWANDSSEWSVESWEKRHDGKFQFDLRSYHDDIYSINVYASPTDFSYTGITVSGPNTWTGNINLGDDVEGNTAIITVKTITDGQSGFAVNRSDFETTANSGFIVGVDSDGLAKLYLGKTENYIEYDGAVLTVKGNITILSGSGISNFTDAGGLAVLDSVDYATQVSGAQKPENNATVGAIWGTNLGSIPIRFADSPSVTGLYATASFIGFYDSVAAGWPIYITNDTGVGKLYAGNGTKFLAWDGTDLNISTDGSLKMLVGGDIQMIGTTGNTSQIKFYKNTTTLTATLYSTATLGSFYVEGIGSGSAACVIKDFYEVDLVTYGGAQLSVADDDAFIIAGTSGTTFFLTGSTTRTTLNASYWDFGSMNLQSIANIGASSLINSGGQLTLGGTSVVIRVGATDELYTSNTVFRPVTDRGISFGGASYQIDDLYAYTYYDGSGTGLHDDLDDISILHGIKDNGNIDKNGRMVLDISSYPDFATNKDRLKKEFFSENGELVTEEDFEEWIKDYDMIGYRLKRNLGTAYSLTEGAVRQVDNKLEWLIDQLVEQNIVKRLESFDKYKPKNKVD